MSEIRASGLRVGDTYAEPGMDPVKVTRLDQHGDTILVWGRTDGDDTEQSLDIDTVVELLERP